MKILYFDMKMNFDVAANTYFVAFNLANILRSLGTPLISRKRCVKVKSRGNVLRRCLGAVRKLYKVSQS